MSPFPLERLQVFREVAFFTGRQPEREVRVVVVDHGGQRRETTVVIEAPLGVSPESTQRGSAVPLIRRAIRLEVVDADLFAGMHVPAGLGEERRHMTGRA